MNDLLKKIDVVIFDLGEVLIDLDYPKVIQGFSNAAKKNLHEIRELVVTAPILQEFEVGKLSPMEFRSQINDLLNAHLDADSFDAIWNSMLKSISISRMELVEKVGEHFETYILSNTNAIHEAHFNQMIKEVLGKPSLYDFVDNAFLSHEIGLRKPNLECYEYVIDDIQADPDKVLFLDDRLDNVMGAMATGIKAIQITNSDLQLNEIFQFD